MSSKSTSRNTAGKAAVARQRRIQQDVESHRSSDGGERESEKKPAVKAGHRSTARPRRAVPPVMGGPRG